MKLPLIVVCAVPTSSTPVVPLIWNVTLAPGVAIATLLDPLTIWVALTLALKLVN